MQSAVLVGIAAEVLVEDELFQLRMNVEFGISGNLFFKNTLGGGKMLVMNAVRREVVANGAVSAAHRHIGIRIHRFVLLHFHQRGHILAARSGELVLAFHVNTLILNERAQHGSEPLVERVGLQGLV